MEGFVIIECWKRSAVSLWLDTPHFFFDFDARRNRRVRPLRFIAEFPFYLFLPLLTHLNPGGGRNGQVKVAGTLTVLVPHLGGRRSRP
jgi:hypothetical protein